MAAEHHGRTQPRRRRRLGSGTGGGSLAALSAPPKGAWQLVVLGAAVARGELLLSRPRRPPAAKFYPPQELLDCEGANFSSFWRAFRLQAAANAQAGYPQDKDLLVRAAVLVDEYQGQAPAASLKFPQVLVRQLPVTRMNDFCLFGYATALFILFRDNGNYDHALEIEQTLGWVEWPLDFTESSAWPTLWRQLPLHLEAYRRGDYEWSLDPRRWGDDERFLPRPIIAEVENSLVTWLRAVGTTAPQRWLFRHKEARPSAAKALVRVRRVRLLVLGHHLGSSMEPFSMLRQALRVGVDVQIEAKLYGQRHPTPGLACREFGYCDENEPLERWFKTYESRWLGYYEWMPDGWDEAMAKLATIIGSSGFTGMADLVVCGGPGWFCVMLRTLWAVPMLLYFAWPAASLVPVRFKNHIFAYIRALGQTSDPPTVFLVANWVLAAQFALQMRMEVPVLRPHGLYVNETYSPVPSPGPWRSPRVLVTRIGQWARIAGIALLELTWSYMEQERMVADKPFPFELVFLSIRIRGTDTVKALSYTDFAGFHACVFWPWDVMMLLFNELYTMTMPLLLPERRWMHHVVVHALRHTEVNWWHLRPSVAGRLPEASSTPFPLPFLPWLGDAAKGEDLPQAAFWYELTDFAQMPHLTTFGSLPDMLTKLRDLDVPRVRAGMTRFNRASLGCALAFYRAAALELLGGGS